MGYFFEPVSSKSQLGSQPTGGRSSRNPRGTATLSFPILPLLPCSFLVVARLLLLALILLSLTPVSLLQTLHSCLAHFGVPREECFDVIWLHDRTDLDLSLVLDLVFTLAIAVCGSDEDRQRARRVEVPKRIVCYLCSWRRTRRRGVVRYCY